MPQLETVHGGAAMRGTCSKSKCHHVAFYPAQECTTKPSMLVRYGRQKKPRISIEHNCVLCLLRSCRRMSQRFVSPLRPEGVSLLKKQLPSERRRSKHYQEVLAASRANAVVRG